MKKTVILSMAAMLLLAGCGQSSNNDSNSLKEIDKQDAKLGEVQNLTTSDKTIPNFTIEVNGASDEESKITQDDLKGMTLYDLVSDVRGYDIDKESPIYSDKWTGVKLTDLLSKKNINDYSSITFKATKNLMVKYTKDEISDDIFLVFYRNGVALSETEETAIMLFAPEYNNRYWVPSLAKIDVEK